MGRLEIWKDDKLLKEEYIDKEVNYTKFELNEVKKNGEEVKWKIIRWIHRQTRLGWGIFLYKKIERDKLFKVIQKIKQQEEEFSKENEEMGFGLFD